MSKKVIIITAIAIISMALFTACLRPAAPLVLSTPTTEGAISTSQPTPTGLSLMQTWGTTTAAYVQTAVAQGTFTAVPPSETPQLITTPEAPTATSLLPGTGVPTNISGITPITTPVIIVPTATPGRPLTYTLQEGEFPYCIARRFNVNPDDILSLNGLTRGEILQPGLVLQIPQTGTFTGTRALNPHPAQYTVGVDDTLNSIACHFGDVDPSAIAAANGLTLTAKPITGTTLNIP